MASSGSSGFSDSFEDAEAERDRRKFDYLVAENDRLLGRGGGRAQAASLREEVDGAQRRRQARLDHYNNERAKALENIHLTMRSFWEIMERLERKKSRDRTTEESDMLEHFGEMYTGYKALRDGIRSSTGSKKGELMEQWADFNHDVIDSLCTMAQRIVVHTYEPFREILTDLDFEMHRAMIQQKALDPDRDWGDGLREHSPFLDHDP